MSEDEAVPTPAEVIAQLVREGVLEVRVWPEGPNGRPPAWHQVVVPTPLAAEVAALVKETP